ncbi:MAG TPA: ATPase, T2SS/T4P/T4SS family, partial [Acidimicrobiales bacterium]|nr:ATPase, T2SS/T4P/T4SS family [Acidimicrobiales bacterium]
MVRELTLEPGASPLAEIESRVQSRAKDLTLDLSDTGRDSLRPLVDQAIAEWETEHRRGLRPFALSDPEMVADRVLRNLAGYGPLEPLLADDDVWEVMVNAPDAIFVKRHLGVSGYHDEVFHDDDHVLRTLTKILDEAAGSHRKLDPAEGLQDAQLDTGARLHIVHGDVGRDGHVLVNIRKFTGIAIRSLDELVERDMLDHAAAELLRAAVGARLSIVFAGAPGSGKTTMLSCCTAELD